VMVSRLRKKLAQGGIEQSIITLRGQGYKFNHPCD
jgi:two-component system response regulator PhoP